MLTYLHTYILTYLHASNMLYYLNRLYINVPPNIPNTIPAIT